MCGIVGVISATVLTQTQQEHFSKLLIMDQVRGFDSCGVIADRFKGTDFIKSVYDPATFLADKKTQSVIGGARGLVGHNRAATRGSIRVQNAHPFNHGAVTLVHNGTLTYPQLPHASQFEVDSESIAYNLSLVGPEGAAGVLEQISGAYALVWRDDRDGSWNLARNDDRFLHIMPLVGGATMYLSSEVGILYAAVHKDIKVDPTTQILPMPVGELWKITSDAGKLVREVINFTPKKPYTNPQQNNRGINAATMTTPESTTNLPVSTSTKVKETYSDAEAAFKRIFKGKLVPGWHKVDIDKEYEGKNGNRHYIGFLSSDPGNEVRIVTTDELSYTEPYEVYVTTLWLDSYGNHKSKTVYDYILSTGSVRKIKKEDTTADEPLQCINCGGVFVEGEMFQLDDGDHLCQLCYTTDDNESKMYAHHIGIAKRPTVKPV